MMERFFQLVDDLLMWLFTGLKEMFDGGQPFIGIMPLGLLIDRIVLL